ncbi:Uncharacterised protein [Vibrio cholerae]|nr:Uncharacterised protein [Vibrio cholerae]CSD01686.1 Uncharacterised protein [Vibrio cholerae]CSI79271.1 Uncharacterised protein [Vibrio cholerae]
MPLGVTNWLVHIFFFGLNTMNPGRTHLFAVTLVKQGFLIPL